MSVPKPRWFDHHKVMVTTAQTCGISKSGGLLVRFDPITGKPMTELDEQDDDMPVINDQLLADMESLRAREATETLQFVDRTSLNMRLAVPTYYDRRYHDHFAQAMSGPQFDGFHSATLRELVDDDRIVIRHGHGSAPKDLRVGDVPYIKVSDLRAGLVNINPTNAVPRRWAEPMWGGPHSGLQAFDLICPERASKNIGDFCVLMPGQEQVLVTKEVIVLRPGPAAGFDAFYLLWAMTLKIVRDQWKRVVFMQTNREDVGDRYMEIEIPVAPSAERATEISEPFRSYFLAIARAREAFREYLDKSDHHFFVSGGEVPSELDDAPTGPTVDVPAPLEEVVG